MYLSGGSGIDHYRTLTCAKCPYYYRFKDFNDLDQVVWRHICEKDPDHKRKICANAMRRAPDRPNWCPREAQP